MHGENVELGMKGRRKKGLHFISTWY